MEQALVGFVVFVIVFVFFSAAVLRLQRVFEVLTGLGKASARSLEECLLARFFHLLLINTFPGLPNRCCQLR